MLIILDNKNHGLPSLNPLLMNDKAVMNMLPNFDDPVEQSLASLEQSLACKFIFCHKQTMPTIVERILKQKPQNIFRL